MPGRADSPWIQAGLAAALFAAAFAYGIRHGMHQMVPEAVGRHTLSMAVAISDLRYGLKGYVAYNNVIDALSSITNDPEALAGEGLKPEHALRDGKRINSALRSAAGLAEPAAMGFYPLLREDKGLVSYYKLAFQLFGYRVEGFYYLYFLLLALSALAYGLAFHRRPDLMHLLFLYFLAHLLVSHAAAATGLNLGTVHNPRFFPVLAVLPALHLAFLALGRRAFTPAAAAGAALQTALLLLVIHSRGSAASLLLLLFFLSGAAILLHWRRYPLLGRYACNRVSLWPVALALCGLLFLKAHVVVSSHPVYSGTPSGHLLWINFYLGLGAHPDSERKHGISYQDKVAFTAARKLARERRGIVLGDSPDNRVIEEVLKEEYFRVLREDPGFFAANYAHKLLLFFRTYFGPAYVRSCAALYAALLAAAALGGWFMRPAFLRAAPRLLSLLAACFVFTLIPAGIAMPEAHVIADPALVLSLIIFTALSAAAAKARSFMLPA